MLTGYYKKNIEKLSRRLSRDTKIFLKKKTKSTNLLVSDIEMLQKMKKKSSINMATNNISDF